MKIILSEKLPRILNNKRLLEERLNVQISNRGKEVSIEGTPEDEYIAEKVIDAINFGFPISDALQILDEEFLFEILNIKNYTKRKDLTRIKARIIGTKGKTFQTLCSLTKCCFELKDSEVGIIGSAECIKNAEDAVKYIIQGSKQANVYSKLEKNQPKPIVDLGLKMPKKKKRI